MERDRKRPRSPPVCRETTRVAIIGSGLAALATAVSLERRGFRRVTVYERDASCESRREGYGLTLKYDPRGVLKKLGILEACARADCPSRSHYMLSAGGDVLGYYGNAFSKNGGYGQRGNLRIPRQTVRQILISALSSTKIEWNHKLIRVRAMKSDGVDDTQPPVQMLLEFSNQKSVLADWVIGADGIRSTVIECLIPNAPPPEPIGVRLILGLTSSQQATVTNPLDLNHPLLKERGFYTLSKGHRLFVMPYSASSPLQPEQETRYMWQLSYAEGAEKASVNKNPAEWLQEASERCHDWHTPVQQLIQSTPLDAVWSAHLCDRDPKVLYDLLIKNLVRQQGMNSDPTFFDRVLLVGDALHAMSCFKGQGANQALLDGVVAAQWLDSAANGACHSPLALVRGCLREIVQRTALIVADSHRAAVYWHSEAVLQDRHKVAGVPSERVEELLQRLCDNNINVNTTPNLDVAIQNELNEMKILIELPNSKFDATVQWTEEILKSLEDSNLEAIRELSWSTNSSPAIRNIRMDRGNTCLHAAARKGCLETVHWMATQAGCDTRVRNDDGQTPRDVAKDARIADLLAQLELLEPQV